MSANDSMGGPADRVPLDEALPAPEALRRLSPRWIAVANKLGIGVWHAFLYGEPRSVCGTAARNDRLPRSICEAPCGSCEKAYGEDGAKDGAGVAPPSHSAECGAQQAGSGCICGAGFT